MITLLENRILWQCSGTDSSENNNLPLSACQTNEEETGTTSSPSAGLFARLSAPLAAFSLGLLRALPESLLTLVPTTLAAASPFCLEKILWPGKNIANAQAAALSPFKPLLMSLPAIITAFSTYPLAHETIETVSTPGSCEDPDFCGGLFEAVIESYTQYLDNSARNLNDWVKLETGTLLPITNPLKVYDNTRSTASTLYNAFFGTLMGQGLGQKGIKFSSPHMKFPHLELTTFAQKKGDEQL